MIRKGQWIWDGADQLGRAAADQNGDTIDVAIYDREGTRVGRTSPAEGGPRGFEPCCDATVWRRIEKPTFPMKRCYFLHELVDLKQ